MPIVSRELRHVRPQRDGTVRVQEHLVDGKGRSWFHSYKAASEADALARMTARDMTAQLKDAEEQEVVDFITSGGDPSTFVKADLTNTEFDRRIAKKFANSRMDLDRQFVCNAASWVAGFAAGQIANALGISNARATAIRNRAIDLRNNVCPALAADDGKVEDVD